MPFRIISALALWLLVSVAHAGTRHYYYTDPQGTVLAKADASGAIVATYDYAPYGTAVASMSPAPNGPGYTGHVNDPDTGLVYMQARYYDPAVGRFLSVDPVGVKAGDTDVFSRYAYANNNPIKNVDPDGREAACITRNTNCLGNGPAVGPDLLDHGEITGELAMGVGGVGSAGLNGKDAELGIIMIGEGASLSIDGKMNFISFSLPAGVEKIPLNIKISASLHILLGGRVEIVINDGGRFRIGVAGGFGFGETVNNLSVNHKFGLRGDQEDSRSVDKLRRKVEEKMEEMNDRRTMDPPVQRPGM